MSAMHPLHRIMVLKIISWKCRCRDRNNSLIDHRTDGLRVRVSRVFEEQPFDHCRFIVVFGLPDEYNDQP